MTTPFAIADPQCGKCHYYVEDILVAVCRHVLEGDFDYDDDGEQVPRIRRTVPLMSKPGPTVHRCDDDTCPLTELCGDCWGDT